MATLPSFQVKKRKKNRDCVITFHQIKKGFSRAIVMCGKAWFTLAT